MTAIIVNIQVPGVHRWLACPIDEVGYLRNYHRHMFHIKCYLKVGHADRDVEIIMFKKKVKDYLREEYFDTDNDVCFFDNMSCEMIAKELYDQFGLEACEVLEDNENGAVYSGLDWRI